MEQVHLVDVAKQWEDDWADVAAETEEIRTQMARLWRNARPYFLHLEKIAKGIRQPGLRSEELEKNADVKRRWKSIIRQAREQLLFAEAVMQEGGDLQKLLLAEALREEMTGHATALRSLSIEGATRSSPSAGSVTELLRASAASKRARPTEPFPASDDKLASETPHSESIPVSAVLKMSRLPTD